MTAIKVKPLVWEDHADQVCVYRTASHPSFGFGVMYRVQRFPLDHPFHPGTWQASHTHPTYLCSLHGSAEEAMAACEEHYRLRVLELLEVER